MEKLLLLFTFLVPVLGYSQPPQDEQAIVIGLGDSIVAGYQATKREVADYLGLPFAGLLGQSPQNEKRVSLATGTEISSLAHYVASCKTLGARVTNVDTLNLATVGAKYSALPEQIEKLKSYKNQIRKSKIVYIVMTIGTNNVCDMYNNPQANVNKSAQIAELQESFRQIINLTGQDQDVRVVVSSIPNITQLALAQTNECSAIAGLLDCRRMIIGNGLADEESRINLIKSENQRIKSTAEAANKLRVGKAQFSYSNGFFEAKLPFDELARDCLHPNPKGQAHIARVIQNDLPWCQEPMTNAEIYENYRETSGVN